MRELLAPYSNLAKAILAAVSAILIAYGIYDAATLQLLIGGLSGVATAFWQAYDTFVRTTKD